jgi:hypothetical protein
MGVLYGPRNGHSVMSEARFRSQSIYATLGLVSRHSCQALEPPLYSVAFRWGLSFWYPYLFLDANHILKLDINKA